MKPILRLSFLLLVSYSLIGCMRKDVVAPQSPITGSWILSSALEGDVYGWQPFYTGLENGIFDLYENGAAQYSDGHVVLQGNWYISNTSGGYYDEYGSYYVGTHQSFDIHVSDYYTSSNVDLHFDNVKVFGNQLVATYYNGTYIESYTFRRY
jgi:hypothetical protein